MGANILLAISEIKDVKNQRPAKLYEICRVATLEINKKLTKNKQIYLHKVEHLEITDQVIFTVYCVKTSTN